MTESAPPAGALDGIPGPVTPPHDVLVDLIISAPGRNAARAALEILRGLASDGDFDAVRALCRVMALELGMNAETPGLLGSRSLGELVRAADIAPLIRLYALGFRSRQLVTDPDLVDLALQAQLTDIAPFVAVVERDAPVGTEALKAFLLVAFVTAVNATEAMASLLSAGAKLAIVDQILERARIVPGDAADASFEFGRDMILRCGHISALMFAFHHELGHHLLAALGGRQADQAVSAGAEELRALGALLPAMLEKSASASGPPALTGDPRRARLANGLSVICTTTRRPSGACTHMSFTDAAGPIDLEVAIVLAFTVLRFAGTDPAQAVAVYSPRGVFHLGFADSTFSATAIAARVRAASDKSLASAVSAAQDWYAALDSAGRTGAKEADIYYLLGILERPATIYAADSQRAMVDQGSSMRVAASAELAGQQAETLAGLLRTAVRCGYPQIASRVLAAGARAGQTGGADPGLADLGVSATVARHGTQAFYIGPTAGSMLSVLAVLHDAGYSIDVPVTEDGQTFLTDAAGRGTHLLSRLLETGAGIDRPNGAGQTALARAAQLARAGAARLLLERGANVNAKDNDGRTALHQAAWRGDSELATLLIQYGADPDSPDNSGSTPLIAAAIRHETGAVRTLVTAGADVDAATVKGETALYFAARSRLPGAVNTIAALLDAGAGIDEEADDGCTPLMAAVLAGDADAVVHLIGRGADVNTGTVDGATPLGHARERHDEKMIEALIAGGAGQ